MVTVALVFLLILLGAWLIWTYAPRPFDVIGGAVVVVLAILYLAQHIDRFD
jgi:hypothetical protein